MKLKLTLLSLGLCAVAMAGQGPVHFVHHYTVGDHDGYKIHVTGSTQMGDLDVALTQVRTIKKVYDNGDADMETSTSDFHVTMNGNDINVPQPPTATERVNKLGIPVDADKGKGAHGSPEGMNFSKYAAAFYDKDIKVGDVITINDTSADGKEKSTGSITLVSVNNGEAKLSADLTNTNPEMDAPAKVHVDMLMDTATSKPNHMEATVSSMPVQQGIVMTNVKMTLDRQK
jgi:hypothetical protein